MSKPDIYTRRQAKRKKTMSHQAIAVSALAVGVVLLFSALFVWGRWNTSSQPAAPQVIDTECLKSVILPDDQPEIKKKYVGFTVSFNPAYHIPNYAAWELTCQEAAGDLPRKSKFFSDPDILGCPTLDDYRNSGFDRGHMAPAGDMKWSAQAMSDSHSLANMCPQDHAVNGGRWASLESKCREWAKRDSALIIICGPVMTDEMPQEIGASHVKVPRRFFKVVMSPFSNPPHAIGFIMPNYYTSDGLEQMACSVDDVEQITGYNFFACLNDSIEAPMERENNFRFWNRKK